MLSYDGPGDGLMDAYDDIGLYMNDWQQYLEVRLNICIQ